MKKTVKKKKAGAAQFEHVEAGIYRNLNSGTYFERPTVNGKRSWCSLDTKNKTRAREELHKRRSGLREKTDEKKNTPPRLVSDVIHRYQKDGYPDRQKQPRQGRKLECEKRNCVMLLKYWRNMPVSQLSLQECDRFHEWRKTQIKRGTGDRTVDLELTTLSNAILWALRRNLIQLNPLGFRRPRYCTSKSVRHCREFMPHDTPALHLVAELLFCSIRSETLGWQMMFEAFTGVRTCEALQMRTDAKPYEPGWITADGKSLCVRRVKNQEAVNPFILIHDGLAAWLTAHRIWKASRYPNSPWFFPNYREPDLRPVDVGALTQALRTRRVKIGKKITSHGMRAVYVTVRRSNGIPDIQIAYEIGHTSAGKTLAAVYGGVPPHWLVGDGPKLTWLNPNGRQAWEAINSATPRDPAQNNGVPAACCPPASKACNAAFQAPAPSSTAPNAAQSCPPKQKPSEPPLCVITNSSYPSSPESRN